MNDLDQDTEIDILYALLKNLPNGKRPRVLYISDNQILRCYKDDLEKHTYMKDHGIVKNIGLGRGELLAIFSKMEFILNEIISKMLHTTKDNASFLDDLLDCVDMFNKMKLLKQIGVVDNKTFGKLMNIKEVRNGFAHTWAERDVKYRGVNISNNYYRFQEDLLFVWKELIEKNLEIQPKISELIDDLMDKDGNYAAI